MLAGRVINRIRFPRLRPVLHGDKFFIGDFGVILAFLALVLALEVLFFLEVWAGP